ncbi:MAG: CehA/McbA family metallohydrolase [bacterium]|nr:CehA/McbA family metallohydrolase [bacterium]
MLLSPRALRRATAALLPLLTGTALWFARSEQGPEPPARDVVLVPFAPDAVRAAVPMHVGVLVYNPGERFASVEVTGVEVTVDGHRLGEARVAATLPGEAEYGAVQEMLERLPEELTHLHRERRWFAPADAPLYAPNEAYDKLGEVRRRIAALREKYASGVPEPFVQPTLAVPLDQVFATGAAVGTEAELEVAVTWRTPGGDVQRSAVTHTLVWLGPRPALPPTSAAAAGGATVHAGDLHVHSCHGEAVNACAPSDDCAAETLQTSGSFTYAELKTQYQALGAEWFTATDHSYCINSDAEYAAIVAETVALTDGAFVVIPDIELSSDEEGPQQGSDTGDILCLGTTEANHMGAHGINSRKEGGDDGFLGFCDGLFDDVLEPFTQNAAAIRAEGGYPIVNHPDAGSFAWNSFERTRGIEENQMHGVEVWNGGTQTGQGGNVGTWVDWLLAGRLLYAYGGSDTHDAAFDFGANNVVVEGALTDQNLEASLKAGNVYVSNGPALLVEVELGGATLGMGSLNPLPSQAPADSVTVRAHYDFGADSGTITVFGGVEGAGSEATLCTSANVSGAGVFECATTLQTSGNSWFRAYAENGAGSRVAYSNPVFFVPSDQNVFTYCTGKASSLGCTPDIAWSGTPSATAGSGFTISASDLIPNSFGLMIYGLAPDFRPFQDATLCVGLPFVRTPIQNSGSGGSAPCSGEYTLDFNTLIASGMDPTLTVGTTVFSQYWQRDNAASFGSGLSNALQFTIQN